MAMMVDSPTVSLVSSYLTDSDDPTVFVYINGEQKALSDFVKWFGRNYLFMNVAKTREMVIDFRKKWTATQPLNIL